MAEVVLTLSSDSGRHRARVFKVAEGSYRIEVDRLIDATDAGGLKRGEFWSVLPGLTSYADSQERALMLAKENLRCGETDSR